MNKQKDSNFELLRIIAMLMIVAYHIYCHCVAPQLTNGTWIETLENGWFCHPIFYKRLLVLAIISPMGKIGNVTFFLISGYYMVQKGNQINILKISKNYCFSKGLRRYYL